VHGFEHRVHGAWFQEYGVHGFGGTGYGNIVSHFSLPVHYITIMSEDRPTSTTILIQVRSIMHRQCDIRIDTYIHSYIAY